MAPEVGLGKPYNLKADVYSFGVLLWQILTLSVPYADYNSQMFQEVVYKKGARPKLKKKWSNSISRLMTSSWKTEIHERPTFEVLFRRMINAQEDDNLCCDGSLDNSNSSNKTMISLENSKN